MNDPSGGDPAGVVQQQPRSSFGQTDLINGDVTPESDATARFQGNDKLLCGIILGVVTFWLFAQTTLNIAPDMIQAPESPCRARPDNRNGEAMAPVGAKPTSTRN